MKKSVFAIFSLFILIIISFNPTINANTQGSIGERDISDEVKKFPNGLGLKESNLIMLSKLLVEMG